MGSHPSQFPQIEIVSNSILETVNGAYAISTNKIYLSDAFVSSANQQSLEALILEEFGHFVDAQVNKVDSAGDEGTIFAALVAGESLDVGTLQALKTEDDHGTITVNGEVIQVEKQDNDSPTLVGSIEGYGLGVEVVNNYAYVASGYRGLEIIDVSNPSTPTLIGSYTSVSWAMNVQIVGNKAYVADHASGLRIIDISNPTNPTLIGRYDTPGLSYGVQVVGNYAYVSDESSGLQIIDISNPSNPTLAGNYDTPGLAYVDLQVVGSYASLVST